MRKIPHSKFKNTGLIFELLVNQITSDTLKGIDSPSISIMKKYFIKTELANEYKLYESIIKAQNLSDTKASLLIQESLENSKKINKKIVKNLKYNLIKEIKNSYDIETFFSSKVKNYKPLASIYVLMESYSDELPSDPSYITNNKMTLLEHITKTKVITEEKTEEMEILKGDKTIRILAYKVLLENFNTKYDSLNNKQKMVLKEFINAMGSSKALKELYNTHITQISKSLNEELTKVQDPVLEIKLKEISNLLTELDKKDKIGNGNIVDLLQYYDLLSELKIAHDEEI